MKGEVTDGWRELISKDTLQCTQTVTLGSLVVLVCETTDTPLTIVPS